MYVDRISQRGDRDTGGRADEQCGEATDPASDAGAQFYDCGSIRHPTADGWRCRDCGRTANRGAEAGIVTTTSREVEPPRMAAGDREMLSGHQF